MDTEAVAALVGIMALLVIGWRRAVDRYRDWQAREHERLATSIVNRDFDEARVRETRAKAHRAHPVVHRWPNDRGAA